jgi:radical SAM superfamily enzyme YgiQ (UPF0313 family)
MMKKEILLINPPLLSLMGIRGSLPLYLPLGLLYIAAVLRENGFEVKVYDPDLDTGKPIGKGVKYRVIQERLHSKKNRVWKEVEKVIKKTSPVIIGINVSTPSYYSALRVAKISKEINDDAMVIVGGYHPTALPEETVKEPYFDIVVRGEGEITMLELVRAIEHGYELKNIKGITYISNGKIIHTPSRNLIDNLDSLPFPARDLLINKESYLPKTMGGIMGSRGCPFRCNYCASPMLWGGKVRFRSPKNIVDEIQFVHNEYNTHTFHFIDFTFTLNRKWVEQICNEIIDRKLDIMWGCMTRADLLDESILKKMKQAGCSRLLLGIESGSSKILSKIKPGVTNDKIRESIKLIRRCKINFSTSIMFGYPTETKEDIIETFKLVRELKPDMIGVGIVVPFPGTEMYKEVKDKNLLLSEDWSNYCPFSLPVVKLKNMSRRKLRNYYERLARYASERNKIFNRKMLFNFNYILKLIKENARSIEFLMRSFKELIKLV